MIRAANTVWSSPCKKACENQSLWWKYCAQGVV